MGYLWQNLLEVLSHLRGYLGSCARSMLAQYLIFLSFDDISIRWLLRMRVLLVLDIIKTLHVIYLTSKRLWYFGPSPNSYKSFMTCRSSWFGDRMIDLDFRIISLSWCFHYLGFGVGPKILVYDLEREFRQYYQLRNINFRQEGPLVQVPMLPNSFWTIGWIM